jgi:hypothetical protein
VSAQSAFAESDPEGNSYQAGPNRKVLDGMTVRF